MSNIFDMTDRLPMSFREKSSWISLLSLLGVFVPFFWNSYRQFTGQLDAGSAVGVAFVLLALFVLLEIVLHAAIAIQSPREAQTPKDERERLIEMRATRIAFHVLITGALAGVAVIHLRNSAWLMQQVVLFAIVLAEVVKFGLQVALYRQDR
jgi:uncharacterized membrane protein